MSTFNVSSESHGARLQDVLALRWPHADRAFFRLLAESGGVKVNCMDVDHGRVRVQEGDQIAVDVGEQEIPAARTVRSKGIDPGSIPVLFENDEYLVVDKPAGLYSVPARFGGDLGLHGLLESMRPGQDLRIVHRLDRDTSGCIALAKGLDAARGFDAALQEGKVEKNYSALVEGNVRRAHFTVDTPLGPDPRRPGKVVAVLPGTKKARDARTEVFVVEAFRRHTLVRLVPHTGRGHQLRVHMASKRHPLVGDRDYGGHPFMLSSIKSKYKHRKGVAERPLLAKMFLHAETLAFPSLDGSLIDVRAELPRPLHTVLEKLRRFAPATTHREVSPCD